MELEASLHWARAMTHIKSKLKRVFLIKWTKFLRKLRWIIKNYCDVRIYFLALLLTLTSATSNCERYLMLKWSAIPATMFMLLLFCRVIGSEINFNFFRSYFVHTLSSFFERLWLPSSCRQNTNFIVLLYLFCVLCVAPKKTKRTLRAAEDISYCERLWRYFSYSSSFFWIVRASRDICADCHTQV